MGERWECLFLKKIFSCCREVHSRGVLKTLFWILLRDSRPVTREALMTSLIWEIWHHTFQKEEMNCQTIRLMLMTDVSEQACQCFMESLIWPRLFNLPIEIGRNRLCRWIKCKGLFTQCVSGSASVNSQKEYHIIIWLFAQSDICNEVPDPFQSVNADTDVRSEHFLRFWLQ